MSVGLLSRIFAVLACIRIAAVSSRRVMSDASAAFFASVLDESPDCYTALFSLASALEEPPLPDRVRARKLLRRAIEIAPQATHGLEARVNLGASYLRSGEMAEALATFDAAIAAAPERFEPYLYRALVYQRTRRKNEALADLDRALERNPALPEAAQIRAAIQAVP